MDFLQSRQHGRHVLGLEGEIVFERFLAVEDAHQSVLQIHQANQRVQFCDAGEVGGVAGDEDLNRLLALGRLLDVGEIAQQDRLQLGMQMRFGLLDD